MWDSVEISDIVEGFFIPFVAVFGILGNVASICVLRDNRLEMKATFREILIMLSIFDTIFVVSATVSFSLPIISKNWKSFVHPFILPWLLPVLQISLNGSIWTTVSVAVERFISIVHPRFWFSSFPSTVYIVPTLILSIVWNIPRWNELFTCIKTHNETVHIGPTMFYSILTNSSDLEDLEIVYPVKYSICPTEMRDNHSYIRDYILLANFIVMAFLPFLILTVINTMLYKTITRTNSTNKRSNNRQKRDQGIAMILAGIVVVFAFCNVFRIVINLYEVFHLAFYGDIAQNWPKWCSLMSDFSHLLLVLNSSVNIIIYGWKDAKFRELLLKLLRFHCMTKNSTNLISNAKEMTEITFVGVGSSGSRKPNTNSESSL